MSNKQLTFGSLFAGIGGFDLGFERAGMCCEWQVEIDPYCQRVLAKHWPNVRRWDDVRTFPPAGDWSVDVICGGFPCQDISIAGHRVGIEGSRSGLWTEYARIVGVLRPRFVVVENVAALITQRLGIDRVCGDLADIGYDAEWDVIPACAFGAPHSRERVFLLAYPNEIGWGRGRARLPDATRHPHWQATQGKSEWADLECWLREAFQSSYGTAAASELERVDEWFPERLDRIGACGNAVVPQVAEWIGRRIVEASTCCG